MAEQEIAILRRTTPVAIDVKRVESIKSADTERAFVSQQCPAASDYMLGRYGKEPGAP
jgi:hypothetical protein